MKKSGHRPLILRIALLLIVIALFGRLFFPPFVSLSKELPAGSFTACELFYEFTGDPTGTYIRLSNKVIILEGDVAEIGSGFCVIGKDMCLIRCMFRKSIYDRNPHLRRGDRITLKGVCKGLNMTEVLVTHCIIINKPAN